MSSFVNSLKADADRILEGLAGGAGNFALAVGFAFLGREQVCGASKASIAQFRGSNIQHLREEIVESQQDGGRKGGDPEGHHPHLALGDNGEHPPHLLCDDR